MTIILSISKIVLLLLLLSVFYVGSAFGETYYVDTTGSDKTGNGSVRSPWKTIAHALDSVGYGNTISINDGIYSEGPLVVPPGVSLTSTSANNTKVRIQPNTSLDTGRPFILLSSASPGSSGNQTISHLEIDGVNGGAVARVGIKVQNRNDVRITNCNIHDFKGVLHSFGVLVFSTQIAKTGKWWLYWPADAQPPGTDTNLDALWPANPVENFELDHNTIKDCGFRKALNEGPVTGSVGIYHLKDSSIHHNTIDSTNSLAQPILGLGGALALLLNVDVYDNNLTMPYYTDRSTYIIAFWNMRNVKIYNNVANANFTITVSKEMSVYNNEIVCSPPQTVGGGNIGIEATLGSELEIYDNTISGNLGQYVHAGLTSVQGDKSYIVRNIVIRDNKFSNNKHFGIAVSAGGGQTGRVGEVTNVDIYKNLVDTSRAAADYSLIYVRQYNTAGTSTLSDVIVENNVLINGPGYAGKTVGIVSNLVIDDNTLNGNKYNSWKGSIATSTKTTYGVFPNGVIDTPSSAVTIAVGDTVDFKGTGTDPDNNLPLSYLWDFDDPAIADAKVEDPGLVPFNTIGSYTVTFTVTDSQLVSDPTPAHVLVTVQNPSQKPSQNPSSDAVIVDNTGAGFSTVGNWGTSLFTQGHYGSNYRYASPGSGSRQATWSFSVGKGNYALSAQWPAFDNRPSNAAYRIYNNGVEIGTQIFDQRVNGGRFNVFDKRYVVNAGTLSVTLTDDAKGYVIADAVKVVKLPISTPSGFKIGNK